MIIEPGAGAVARTVLYVHSSAGRYGADRQLLAVAAAHGGLPEIVRDGETGRLVPPGDPGALAGVLAELAAYSRSNPPIIDRTAIEACPSRCPAVRPA